MEEKDIAIKFENIKKQYRLGVIGGGTLQEDIQSWIARKRGKEDLCSAKGRAWRFSGAYRCYSA